MPNLTKAMRRDTQTRKARAYTPRHRSLSRTALRASRQARRALVARYAPQ